MRESGKRPRDAYTDAVTSISKRFKLSRVQADVIGSFSSFGEVRRQLNRYRIARNSPFPDVLNIPEQLRVTLRGRDVLPDDVCFNERFLLHTGLDERLVFCADTELLVMHDGEYLICDGTFEMSPDSTTNCTPSTAFAMAREWPWPGRCFRTRRRRRTSRCLAPFEKRSSTSLKISVK